MQEHGHHGAHARSQRYSDFFAFLVRHRAPIQAGLDGLTWIAALAFATLVRYDFEPTRNALDGLALAIPLAVVLQITTGFVLGLYGGRWRFGAFEEVAAVVRATALATVLLFVVNQLISDQTPVPRSAVAAGGLTALVLMAALRYLWRLVLEARRRPRGESCGRLLVFGAGEGGAQAVTAMLADPASPYLPVALLDDSPRRRKLRIKGVAVVGTRFDLAEAAALHQADGLLIAIPSAGPELINDLSVLAAEAGLSVKVLPPVGELFGTQVGVSDIRSVTIADLLGRHEIHIDLASIAGYLTGKRVLITGAGGSIGSELCRQVYRFAPAELVMVDRDESALLGVQLSIEGRALLDSPDLILLDLRDRQSLHSLFAERRPEVVFHAGALKHQPLLERHPAEALKTNVWGTLAVLEAAVASGAERVVNISTDKAADPCSVLGYSKRVTERLTAHVAGLSEGVYMSVRFGNVLGSRGSMLGTFNAQIALGGPLTVTHPDITRYFMTVEEAVQLVIQAGAIGRDGEALVLDMGQPVRIDDVARRLSELAERPVEIVYTGLRPGEKLHEVLLGSAEADDRPVHPLVSHVDVPPLDPEEVRWLDPHLPTDELRHCLSKLCADLDSHVPPPG